MKTIMLPCFDITVELIPDPYFGDGKHFNGTIKSSLKSREDDNDSKDPVIDACMDSIESMILAHACAGIDITSPEYIEGVETAVESVFNNHG